MSDVVYGELIRVKFMMLSDGRVMDEHMPLLDEHERGESIPTYAGRVTIIKNELIKGTLL